jgi:hypothetical protein
MRRLMAILSTLALIASLTVSSVAAAPGAGQQSRVIANIVMAPSGTTDAVGRVIADVHAPANSADVPGDYSFDGNAANDLKHARGVVQRAFFWLWQPGTPAEANFAFIEGVQCLYWASQDPSCTDASWAFIDYRDPGIPDVQVSCWWDDGVRPAAWAGTWNSCDSRFTPTAHQDWYDVVQGSLVVQLAPQGVPQVVHANLPCDVSWYTTPGGIDSAGGCDVQNVMTPNGGYKLTLHGQIPADQMAAFRAAGSPSSFATTCLVNYGFLATATPPIPDWTGLMVFTPSVRHFTKDGKMTEVCEKSS